MGSVHYLCLYSVDVCTVYYTLYSGRTRYKLFAVHCTACNHAQLPIPVQNDLVLFALKTLHALFQETSRYRMVLCTETIQSIVKALFWLNWSCLLGPPVDWKSHTQDCYLLLLSPKSVCLAQQTNLVQQQYIILLCNCFLLFWSIITVKWKNECKKALKNSLSLYASLFRSQI